MKTTIALIAFLTLLLVGCVSTSGVHVNAPSLGSVSDGAKRIGEHVDKSTASIKSAEQIIADLDKENPAFVPKLDLIDTPLNLAIDENAAAQKEVLALKMAIIGKQGEIDQMTTDRNKLSDRVATDELSLAKAHERIWQLWIALGSLVGLAVAFFIARQYLPFLKAI